MNTTTMTPSLAEKYIMPLINLPDTLKREIIRKLSATMMTKSVAEEKEETVDLYNCFHGDWGNECSTEEYCSQLRTEAILDADEVATW